MEFYKKRKKYYSNLYPKEIYEKLEFDKILNLVEEACQSPLGLERVKNIKYLTKHDEVEKQLRQVYEFTLLLNDSTKQFPSNHYLALEKELHLLEIEGSVLSEKQVFRIYKVLKTVSDILHFFRQKEGEYSEEFPELARLTKDLEVDKNLLNAINRVLDDEGKIKSSASKELTTIRNNISFKYRELDNKFKAAVNEFKRMGYLDDTLESIRNGRRVLSVVSNHKRKIKGIILDQSSSGRITYMEPESTLQVNNDIFELQQEEKQEIHRILKSLSDQLRPFQQPLKDYQNLLGLLDFIQAKAKLALRMNGVMPVVARERVVELEEAYHPLLLLLNNEQKKVTIPMSLRLSIAERILVISGPNAGGKSVSLKTIGLLQIMLQCGMLLPIKEGSMMGLFNNIFCDIGDEQSLENDLSTYSSRLLNMRYFIEHSDAKTLILIDEFGSGTDPKFGGAIAEALLEELNKKRVYGVITTHYSNIKIYATEAKGVINGFMQFDKKNLKPLYKLDIGKPGSSYAFEIAEKCGLHDSVLTNARSKVGEDYQEFDELLAELQNEKVELDLRTQALRKEEADFKRRFAEYERKSKELKKRKQKMLLEAEAEALELVQNTNKKYDKLLKEWSDNKAEKKIVRKIKEEIQHDKDKKKQRIEKLRDQVLYRKSTGVLEVGSTVQLRGAGEQVGTVDEIKGKTRWYLLDCLEPK